MVVPRDGKRPLRQKLVDDNNLPQLVALLMLLVCACQIVPQIVTQSTRYLPQVVADNLHVGCYQLGADWVPQLGAATGCRLARFIPLTSSFIPLSIPPFIPPLSAEDANEVEHFNTESDGAIAVLLKPTSKPTAKPTDCRFASISSLLFWAVSVCNNSLSNALLATPLGFLNQNSPNNAFKEEIQNLICHSVLVP